jgi:hypothetical protein
MSIDTEGARTNKSKFVMAAMARDLPRATSSAKIVPNVINRRQGAAKLLAPATGGRKLRHRTSYFGLPDWDDRHGRADMGRECCASGTSWLKSSGPGSP